MLDMAHKTFANAGRHTDAAKLLLILSDGRGIFNEGQGNQNLPFQANISINYVLYSGDPKTG